MNGTMKSTVQKKSTVKQSSNGFKIAQDKINGIIKILKVKRNRFTGLHLWLEVNTKKREMSPMIKLFTIFQNIVMAVKNSEESMNYLRKADICSLAWNSTESTMTIIKHKESETTTALPFLFTINKAALLLSSTNNRYLPKIFSKISSK